MGICCGSQIVLCDVPIHFDTYKGCSHACKYCFVKKKTDISKIEKDNCIKALQNFIKGKRTAQTKWCDWDIPLHWGGVSDPFQPAEKKHRVSYEALKIFAETKYPFIVSTKGKLVAEPEYLQLIKKCNCVIQISAVCSKYDILEQGAPTFEERVKIMSKVAKVATRVIVRIQPYMVEVHQEVLQSLEKFKAAGVYGITIEGMKFATKQDGLVKIGNDFCYPKNVLEKKFKEIKRKCHELGLAFFCAENRLRTMGDDMCCCGIKGLTGFKTNKYNLEHLYNGEKVEPTERMKQKGTAPCFKAIFQDAGSGEWLKTLSFEEVMESDRLFKGYEDAIIGGYERNKTLKNTLKFTKWLRSTGITNKEVNDLTESKMGSHYLCVKADGQCEIPTPEMFQKIVKSHKITTVPQEIINIVYGEQSYRQQQWERIKAGSMSDNKIQAEIARVKTAIENTQSEYLRRDYSKYLKRLEKQLKAQKHKGG